MLDGPTPLAMFLDQGPKIGVSPRGESRAVVLPETFRLSPCCPTCLPQVAQTEELLAASLTSKLQQRSSVFACCQAHAEASFSNSAGLFGSSPGGQLFLEKYQHFLGI